MKIDCSELFPDSHLHLLVWDRLDDATHKAGLKFMCELMTDTALSGQVMPLLRPLGREPKDYAAFDACTASSEGHLPPDKCRWNSCEVWFQVAETAEDELWNKMLDWRQKCSISWSKAWRSRCKPDWQPLSLDLASCTYYCELSPFFEAPSERFLGAKHTLVPLGDAYANWLLKTIWYRATEVIRKHRDASSSLVLHPSSPAEGDKIVDLLGKILSDLVPRDYGIPQLVGSVDPSAFAMSHMSAFAVNALLPGDSPYLENYLQHQCVTRPCLYGSREDYLASVETLMKRRWGPA